MKEWRATIIRLGGGDPLEIETDDPAELLEGMDVSTAAVISFAHIGAFRPPRELEEPAARGRELSARDVRQ